ANVVLGNAFGVIEGVAVDTHVKRLSNRLGLSDSTDPEKIERDLMIVIPKDEWFTFTYLLIEHGRAVCDAKRPRCDKCLLNDDCLSAFIF
ncbi:MAG TPA: endonuclease III, partial [Anaerolineae bacterium]|nr:endonuclease III [Anaerolineae bacterium]